MRRRWLKKDTLLLHKLVASKTGIPTHVADEAVSCVAYGTGNCLENLAGMQDGTMNLSRQREMMK